MMLMRVTAACYLAEDFTNVQWKIPTLSIPSILHPSSFPCLISVIRTAKSSWHRTDRLKTVMFSAVKPAGEGPVTERWSPSVHLALMKYLR